MKLFLKICGNDWTLMTDTTLWSPRESSFLCIKSCIPYYLSHNFLMKCSWQVAWEEHIKGVKIRSGSHESFLKCGNDWNNLINWSFLSTSSQFCKASLHWRWKGKQRIPWRPHSTFSASVIISITAACSLWRKWHVLCDHFTPMKKYRCGFCFSFLHRTVIGLLRTWHIETIKYAWYNNKGGKLLF